MGQKFSLWSVDQINLLIVGNYLHQKTGDLTYLNRSLSVLEGYMGAGTNYWVAARKLIRTNPAFAEAKARKAAALAALEAAAEEDSLADLVKKMETLNEVDAALADDFPELREEVTASRKIDLVDLQRRLAADSSGVMSFYVKDNVFYRLYVDADSIEMTVMNRQLPEAGRLANELHTKVSLNKPAEEISPTARRLYQLLFAGHQESLPARMHLIAEGPLANLPFAALRRDTSGTPRYLGVECALSRQFTIGSMLQLEALDLEADAAYPLALAPAFRNNLLQAADLREAGYHLSPLLYNTDEVKQLADRSYGDYYLDDEATVAAYQGAAPDHNIIHLATHAISSQTDGLRSRIYLLDDEAEPASLFAGDIGEQTLNADLVVLSACETGTGGQHSVEGTIGLHRAYLAAGARAVVASLWAVDDYATAALMKEMYAGLAAGLTPDRALQRARRAYLTEQPDAPPYKWAAFEAYGGMRPVRWEPEAPVWPKVLWGLGGLALLGGFWKYKTARHAA